MYSRKVGQSLFKRLSFSIKKFSVKEPKKEITNKIAPVDVIDENQEQNQQELKNENEENWMDSTNSRASKWEELIEMYKLNRFDDHIALQCAI